MMNRVGQISIYFKSRLTFNYLRLLDEVSFQENNKNLTLLTTTLKLGQEMQKYCDQQQKINQQFTFQIDQLNKKPIKTITRQKSQSSVNSQKTQSPQVDKNNQGDYLRIHRDQISEYKKSRLSIKVSELPPIIKQQNGIFNQEMPYQFDIAKEFSENDFRTLILLLLMQYFQENKQEDSIFITHVKNKFKITIASLKEIQSFFNSIKQDSNIKSLYTRLFESIRQQYTDNPISRKMMLFATINHYWSQYLLNVALGSQILINKEQFTEKFKQIIQETVLKQDKSIPQFFQSDDITYPLNQCILEIIINISFEQSQLDLDYLELLIKFSGDVLKISPSMVSVTILSSIYIYIIQPAIKSKDQQLQDALIQVDGQIQNLWEIIKVEQIANSTQLQKILRLKNCERLFQDLCMIFKNFWTQLPTNQTFLNPFYRLLLISLTLQLEFTQFKTTKEILQQLLQQAGNQFYQFILKKSQCKFTEINKDTIKQVAQLLTEIEQESQELIKQYIDLLSNEYDKLFQEKDTKQFLFFSFLDGATSELLIIVKNYELCVKSNMLQMDQEGNIFLICLKISIMDDRMKPFMLITEFMKALGQQLEIWLEKIKQNTFEILNQCINNEKFQDQGLTTKQLMEQKETRLVQDYCNLLFKSVESIEKISQISSDSQLRVLIQKRLDALIYQAVLQYLEALELEIQDRLQKQYNGFQPLSKNKQTFQVDEQKLAVHNINQCISLSMRLCNVDFIQNSLIHFRDSGPLIETLSGDFKTKGNNITKCVAQIVCNEVIQQTLFQTLYQELHLLEDVVKFQKNNQFTIFNQVGLIDDYLTIFDQKLPNRYISTFYDFFIQSFFQKYYFCILDINKIQKVNQPLYNQLIQTETKEITKFFYRHVKGERQLRLEIRLCYLNYLIKIFQRSLNSKTNKITN
ncbi:hypothetical protein pb186bvf_009131 [Paramecium bursaria]